jgi:hypothetical protein
MKAFLQTRQVHHMRRTKAERFALQLQMPPSMQLQQ